LQNIIDGSDKDIFFMQESYTMDVNTGFL
jgi:hypothetical protein